MVIGNKVIHFKRIESTNEYAKHNLNNLTDGDVVIADEQTKGKGRLGKDWYSPKSGLWFSLVLRSSDSQLAPLAIGLALCDALEGLGFKARIKWPNDIVINSKKVAGILIEVENHRLIVGIGMNTNILKFPEPLANEATSLYLESGNKFGKTQVLARILQAINQRYNLLVTNQIQELFNDWRRHSAILGQLVLVTLPRKKIEGSALDIDIQGALLIRTEDGSVQRVVAGDCQLIRVLY